jgi:hypothetical protein
MTAKELREWVDTLPEDGIVQLMLHECAEGQQYTTYNYEWLKKTGGWVELDGRFLRVMREHPDRRPALVAEKLLR